jgi:hypothetical protein
MHRIVIKVRPANNVESVSDIADVIFDANGRPEQSIMQHLLELYAVHLGSLVPYLSKPELEARLREQSSPIFLFNAIAAATAR